MDQIWLLTYISLTTAENTDNIFLILHPDNVLLIIFHSLFYLKTIIA